VHDGINAVIDGPVDGLAIANITDEERRVGRRELDKIHYEHVVPTLL
jgi:hypothetical protein